MISVFNASSYTNIAAEKLAAMHGCVVDDDVNLFTPVPNLAYISAIFSWEREKADLWAGHLRSQGCEVVLGGPGLSTETWRDIEDFPLGGFALSYTSAGCVRECPWCIVPRMWSGVRELNEWGYAPRMLDPNILATSWRHKESVISRLAGRRVEWNGGLDTRLVDRRNAEFAAATSSGTVFLSWDTGEDDGPIVKALENLRTVGIDPRRSVKVYILTGYEGGWTSLESTGRSQAASRGRGRGRCSRLGRWRSGISVWRPEWHFSLSSGAA